MASWKEEDNSRERGERGGDIESDSGSQAPSHRGSQLRNHPPNQPASQAPNEISNRSQEYMDVGAGKRQRWRAEDRSRMHNKEREQELKWGKEDRNNER